MLSAPLISRAAVGIPFGDPIAQSLLGDAPQDTSLGVFVTSGSRGLSGLGIFGIDDAMIAAAIPAVSRIVQRISKSTQPVTDPISQIWSALPASSIGATVGSDGWWYKDGTRLSHDDAAKLQQAVTAGTIGATVGSDGWWYKDGAPLTHAQAWQLYQQLSGVSPTLSAGGVPGLSPPLPNHPISVAGFTMPSNTTLMLVGAAVLLFVVVGKRRAR